MLSISITGISGRFAECANIEEFKTALLNNKDLISDDHDRWPYKAMDTPRSLGIVKDLDRFDASFFGVNPKQSIGMEPRSRKLLEVVFECIVDSGTNPIDLKGSNTGVFLAIAEEDAMEPATSLLSTSTSLIANNISYTFDFKGPSSAINTGCSSSLYALNQAVDCIRLGYCDSAIVCGAQTHLSPKYSVELTELGVLNPEGRCKTFDEERNGYVKSDAIVSIFVQKVENSKRIYAEIVGIGTNIDGYKQEGIVHPSSKMQKALLKDIYNQFKINPNEVCYIEAHGTGTLVGDLEECTAIRQFFCTDDRIDSLLIGSVKSNAGHAEWASGLVSLAKVIIALHSGTIPANLHFQKPDYDVLGVLTGKLKVVSENTPYKHGLYAVNSFGFGGANGHVVLRPNSNKKPEDNDPKSERLVLVSGRSKEAVKQLLNEAHDSQNDKEFLTLLDEIFEKPVENHNYRGYTILGDNSLQEIVSYESKPRSIWFSYSGMGSQWPKMARDLIKIKIFKDTLQKCCNAVKPYGMNLEEILLNGTEETFENVLNCLTSVVAMLVSLTEVLFSLGIRPDKMIGHSVGEIGCAYADGHITAEQATLIAFARGYAIMNNNVIPGLMAAVKLSVDECEKMLPSDIVIGCHNFKNNVTISGPINSVQTFVDKLTLNGIFAKIIPTANTAFHSYCIHNAGPKLLEFLKKIIPEPSIRSKKWLSTSVAEAKWGTDLEKYHSVEYHYNNFMNRVHFQQVVQYIPKNAILVEVAPRGIFQVLFRKNLDASITNISLLSPHKDNFQLLLSNIGKIYINGGQPSLGNFNKKSKFPVSKDASMISSLIKWDHSTKWAVPQYEPDTSGTRITIDLNNKEYKYLSGHVLNGKTIFPFAGYIIMAWQTFAKMNGKHFEEFPVIFEELEIHTASILTDTSSLTVNINIFKTTGEFNISNKTTTLATGKIFSKENVYEEFLNFTDIEEPNRYEMKMNSDDVYKELYLRGYDYDGLFRGISQCTISGRTAQLKWYKNWVSFVDTIIQTIIVFEKNEMFLPRKISRVIIDPYLHKKSIDSNEELHYDYNKLMKTGRSGGVEIRNITGAVIIRHQNQKDVIYSKYQFIPNITKKNQTNDEGFKESLRNSIQIVIENNLDSPKLSIIELNTSSPEKSELKNIVNSVTPQRYLPSMSYRCIDSYEAVENLNLLVISNVLNFEDLLLNFEIYFNNKTFIFINIFDGIVNEEYLNYNNFVIVYRHQSNNGDYVLIKKQQSLPEKYSIITVNNYNFNWVNELKVAIKNSNKDQSKVYLISKEYNSGLLGLFNCLKQESLNMNLRIFHLEDTCEENFSLYSKFFKEEIKKDLTVNVYKNKSWGSFRTVPLVICKKMTKNAFFKTIKPNMEWVEDNNYRNKENKTLVHFASLGKWDHEIYNSNVTHPVLGDACLGLEYSGIDADSEKNVMGISPNGTLRTVAESHILRWDISQNWSMEEASTVPLAYTMGYYGLFHHGHIKPRNSVLFLNATNHISLATITLALHHGYTIYACVNTLEEKAYLQEMIPEIQNNSIILSKDRLELKKIIISKTKEKGVDIVFNSTSKETIPRDINDFLSIKGKLINIDINGTSEFNYLIKNSCQVHNVSVKELFSEPDEFLETIRNIIQEYIQLGVLKSFKYLTFNKDEIQEALTTTLESKFNIDKVVIKLINTDTDDKIAASPRTYFDPEKTYIVVGGLGGFGLELTKWMIARGANKIILNSRSEIKNGYQAYCIRRWRNAGHVIMVNTDDSTNYKETEKLINQASCLGTIGGIFHLALVIKNNLFLDLSDEDFETVVAPKFSSADNLNKISQKLCPSLDYFVVFSSLVASIGNVGQTNYGFANSALERLCEERKKNNLPALAIQWGPIDDVGYVARLKTKAKIIDATPQRIESCLNSLDFFLQQECPVVSSCVYNNINEEKIHKNETVVDMVAKLFGIKDIENVNYSTSLSNLGMDSLMTLEIKNLLLVKLSTDFSVNEIRNFTLGTLKELEF